MNGIQVGNGPCSWGSLEFEGMQGKAIGYAQMLDELAETGYRGTELGDWGYLPTEPGALHQALSQRALAMVGAFVPVAFKDAAAHADGEAKALQVARLLAEVHRRAHFESPPFLVLADDNGTDPIRTKSAGRVRPEWGLTEAQWTTYAQGANRLAKSIKQQTGLPTLFHHHCAGFVETPDEIAKFLSLTDPELIGLVFDTGHFTYGTGQSDGVSAAQFLEQFQVRIPYLHFKDCHPQIAQTARSQGWDYFAAVRHGVYCELGQGSVDFPAIVAWLKKRHYEGWVLVEQDVLPGLGTPKESAKRNREYLRSIGL
jgi:inosose dehydratase